MARPLRVQFEDALYHVCARGNARERIFRGEKDQARFVTSLAESAQRFRGLVHSFVLMGNHFHLIVQTPRANLTRWMHWLSVAYTVYFNRRHNRSGHLFQGRYKSFLIEGRGDYLLTLSRYLHLNPVRGVNLGRGTPAERRERLRAFKWSSYPGYAGLTRPFPFVEEAMVLSRFAPGSRQEQRVRYRRFVEEGLLGEVENPFEAVRWQTALGSESFLGNVRDRVKALARERREIKPLREMTPSLTAQEVLARVAKKHKIEAARLLRGEHGLAARNVAMWMIWEGGSKSLREIGEFFGGMDYAAVAQRIQRARRSHNPKETRELRRQILNI